MYFSGKKIFSFRFLGTLLLFSFLLSGCAYFNQGNEKEPMSAVPATSNPYYPKDFKAILIPDGLVMNRENSMFVKTDSFNGGILHFDGRLEVNSLTEFFENSMPKNGWKKSGSVKAQKNLLIFTKPNQTCMITVAESKFTFKTDVFVYISEDVSSSSMIMQ